MIISKKTIKQVLLISLILINYYAYTQTNLENKLILGIYRDPLINSSHFYVAPADYNNDGKCDLGVKINENRNKGVWRINYYNNGFDEAWDWESGVDSYGGKKAIPIPGDYKTDGITDLALYYDDGTNIYWKINYAYNGFGIWDVDKMLERINGQHGYPAPADYDGDGLIDISVKLHDGRWLINKSQDGFNDDWDWESGVGAYGGENAIPVPGFYDSDTLADLAVYYTPDQQYWYINYSYNGYGAWDSIFHLQADSLGYPMPFDYDKDGKTDITLKFHDGSWKINKSSDGFNDNWDDEFSKDFFGGREAIPFIGNFDGDENIDFGQYLEDGRIYINYGDSDSWSRIGYCTDDYNIHFLDTADLSKMQKVKDAYINLLSGTNKNLHYKYAFNDYYLALSAEVGLQMMVYNTNTYADKESWSIDDMNNFDSAKCSFMTNHFESLDSALRDAMFGYNMGEEPNDTNQIIEINVKKWLNAINSEDKEKFTYMLLYPDYVDSKTVPNYGNYINRFINDPNNLNNPNIIVVDHYPFTDYDDEPFRTSYFHNISLLRSYAIDKPFWSVVNTIGMPDSHIPSPDDYQLRFMTFCPLAYGAKGLMYFYYTDSIEDNVEKYNFIQNLNHYFHDIVGPVIMNSKWLGAFHQSNTILNENYYFPDSSLIENSTFFDNVNNDNILIGLFQTNDDLDLSKSLLELDNYYALVINKHREIQNNVIITVYGDYRDRIAISSKVEGYHTNPDKSYQNADYITYNELSNTTSFSIQELLPGEGRMIKFVSEVVPCPYDYDGDGKTDLAIKSMTGQWRINYASNDFDDGWDWWSSTGAYGGDYYALPGHYDIYHNDNVADLAILYDPGDGYLYWYINYGYNGYGSWDTIMRLPGFSGIKGYPAVSDYDGDGKSDISVKLHDGRWLINKSQDGFNDYWDWESGVGDYGGKNAIPVPGHYDNDTLADLAVYYTPDQQYWYINYYYNGYGAWDSTFNLQTNNILGFCAPADYDGDGKSDISVKLHDGRWLINKSQDGFNDYWDWESGIGSYGNNTAVPLPADYDGDNQVDLSIRTKTGNWLIDYQNDGFGSWNRGSNSYLTTFKSTSKRELFEIEKSSEKSKEVLITNYPNPFSESTTIKYYLPDNYTGTLVIDLFDINGQLVQSLINMNITTEFYSNEIELNSYNLIPGIYFIRLSTNIKCQIHKIVRIK